MVSKSNYYLLPHEENIQFQRVSNLIGLIHNEKEFPLQIIRIKYIHFTEIYFKYENGNTRILYNRMETHVYCFRNASIIIQNVVSYACF